MKGSFRLAVSLTALGSAALLSAGRPGSAQQPQTVRLNDGGNSLARPLRVSTPEASRLNLEVPVSQVGPIQLGDAVAFVTDRSINVFRRFELGYGDKTPVLSGVVVRLERDDDAARAKQQTRGLVVFTSGSSIESLISDQAQDLIFRSAGAVSGKILRADNDTLLISRKSGAVWQVPFKSVTFVRSPRAFIFTVAENAEPAQGIIATSMSNASIRFQSTAGASGVALSSVVPHKKGMLEDLFDCDEDEDDSLLKLNPLPGVGLRTPYNDAPAVFNQNDRGGAFQNRHF